MKKYHLLFCLFTLVVFGQKKNIQLSEKSSISIITCAPGVNDLHAFFGHSAIRVKDPKTHLDQIYNYGTFDFRTPNFYLKFCRGQLLYQVISYPYKYFPYEYYKENRWIKSQTLNLSPQENQKIYDFLEWNILPENKKYKYDFFYNNCATKLYEIIEKCINPIDFNFNKFPKNLSHRNLIHQYLPSNSWSKFGIDLALGAVIDKKASLKAYLFLPDYTWLAFGSSNLNKAKLIKKENYILTDKYLKLNKTFILISPLFISILILLISIATLFYKKPAGIWQNSLFVVFGILGLIVMLLWFFTEHSTTKNNFNILWANPILLSIPFLKNKLKQYVNYLYLVCLIIFVVIAVFGIQEFNSSFFVLASALTISSLNKLLPFKV